METLMSLKKLTDHLCAKYNLTCEEEMYNRTDAETVEIDRDLRHFASFLVDNALFLESTLGQKTSLNKVLQVSQKIVRVPCRMAFCVSFTAMMSLIYSFKEGLLQVLEDYDRERTG